MMIQFSFLQLLLNLREMACEISNFLAVLGHCSIYCCIVYRSLRLDTASSVCFDLLQSSLLKIYLPVDFLLEDWPNFVPVPRF